MSGSEDDLSLNGDDLQIIEENAEQNHETEANENQVEANEPNESQEGADAAEDKKEVKIKRVRNPQPKLNVERLKGPRGLRMLQNVFEDVKFKGRGHEEEDLSVLMKNYEYWCHRLFPKFPFDNCLERMEKLGTKKPMQTYIKRIRMDMLLDDEIVQEQDEVVEDTGEDIRTSDFDALLPQRTQTQSQPTNSGSTGLTEEQLQRIQINRETAQRVRQQMLIRNKARTESLTQIGNQSSRANTDNDIITISPQNSVCNTLNDNDFIQNMSVDSENFPNHISSPNLIEEESFSFQTTAIVHESKPRKECAVSETITNQKRVDSATLGNVSDKEMTAVQESSPGGVNNHNSFNNSVSQEPVENMSVDNPSKDNLNLISADEITIDP